MPEKDPAVVDEIRDRVRTAAAEWNLAAYAEASTQWNDGVQSVMPLRTCLNNYCRTAMKLRIRVKRRERETLLKELASTAFAGYFLGRYLLRTNTHTPTYWTDGDDRENKSKAELIYDGTPAWDFKVFQNELLQTNQELSDAINRWASVSPLLQHIGDERGTSAYRGLLAFGVASALSEEVVFGPTDSMASNDNDIAYQRKSFQNLPGTHVHTRTFLGTKREYVQGDGTVLATRKTYWRKSPLYPNPRVTVDGRVFEERLLGKRRNNHMRSPREVVDLETGERLFRVDGLNFNGSAAAVIRFSESRWYSFPVVEGTKGRGGFRKARWRTYPVMRAVDNGGRVALQYGGVTIQDAEEIVISPDQSITSELLVMMATASPFIAFFFLKPGQ